MNRLAIGTSIIIIIAIALGIFSTSPSGEMRLESIQANTPDLAVISLEFIPTEPLVDEMIIFSVGVENKGTVPVDNLTITFGYGNGQKEEKFYETIISPGGEDIFLFNYSYSTGGTYIVKATVFNEDDGNHDNDFMETELNVTEPFIPPEYDLKVTDISWYPHNPNAGETVEFVIYVQNIGSVISIGANAEFSSGTGEPHTFFIPELEPQQSGYEEVSYTYEEGGSFDLIATIDIDDANNDNNILSEILEVTELDDNPPSVFVYHYPDIIFANTTVTITGNATDDVGVKSIELFIDNSSVGTCDFTEPPLEASCVYNSTFGEGNHSYHAIAKDTINQERISEIGYFFVVENEGTTTTTITTTHSPLGGIGTSTDITLTAEVESEIDIEKIDVYVDELLRATCIFPLTELLGKCSLTSVFESGEHEYYAVLTDENAQEIISSLGNFVVV
ncbi:CARDB domain-containing protein [Candidatus Aenigmatarchaeota archaeon]